MSIFSKIKYYKKEINKKLVEKLKFQTNSSNNKYKVEDIYNSVIYAKKLKLYYLVFWKNYYKNENI